MRSHRRIHLVVCLGLLVCLPAAPAIASAGAEENAVNTTVGMVFKLINFGIVAFGVWYVFGRRLPKAFRGRAERIAGSIADAAQAKREAERRLREAGQKLARLEQEVAELRASAQRDSAAEAERIRAMAREEAVKVERAAEAEMLAAERAARMELKGVAARLAVERAEAIVRGKMTPETQAAIFRAFVSDLGGRSAN